MGGVWYLYGTCFTAPHVAPRPLYKGNAEDDVRSRRFFALSSPKNVYTTRAKFPRHKHQVCPREASCSHGGRAHLPCHKRLSSLPQEAIFLATNDTLALGLQESHSVPGTVCLNFYWLNNHLCISAANIGIKNEMTKEYRKKHTL